MGANQDSSEIAFNLSIRNSRNFDYSAEGTMETMAKDTCTRMNFFGRLHAFHSGPKGVVSKKERNESYAAMADEAFDEEESKG
jgi:hypothetical protein